VICGATWGGCLHGAGSELLPSSSELGGNGNYGAVPTISIPQIQIYLGIAYPEGLKPAQTLCRSRVNSKLVGAVTSDFSRSNHDWKKEKIGLWPGKRGRNNLEHSTNVMDAPRSIG